MSEQNSKMTEQTQASAGSKKPKNLKVDEAYARYIAQRNNYGVKGDLKTVAACVAGSFLIAFNLKVMLNQAGLVPAGFNGLITLIQRIARHYFNVGIPFLPLSLIFNLVPGYMAFRTVGKKYVSFSCLVIFLYSIFTDIIPNMSITGDSLLISVFGGLLNGFACSLILNNGACTGGTDFVAMYFSVKKGISTFNYVLCFNAVLVLISGILFGMDSALYTIIYQFVATQTINTLYRRYARKTVFVVTDKPNDVADEIMSTSRHAATIFEAEGAYAHNRHYIVYSIIGAEDTNRVRKNIKNIDPSAFINFMTSDSISGNFYLEPYR